MAKINIYALFATFLTITRPGQRNSYTIVSIIFFPSITTKCMFARLQKSNRPSSVSPFDNVIDMF